MILIYLENLMMKILNKKIFYIYFINIFFNLKLEIKKNK
jgi:hypothetical protein